MNIKFVDLDNSRHLW